MYFIFHLFTELWNHHHSLILNFFIISKRNPVFSSSQFFPTPSLQQPIRCFLLFAYSRYLMWMGPYSISSFWLLFSLSIVFSRFTHVVTCNFIPPYDQIISILWTYYLLFIHHSTFGWSPLFGYYEKCCCKCWWTSLCGYMFSFVLGINPGLGCWIIW